MNASIYPNSLPPQSNRVEQLNLRPQKSRLLNLLWMLLFAQLLLAVGLFAYQRNAQPDVDATPLLPFSLDSIDKLIISDADKKVTLVKSDQGWHLPEANNLPVSQTKLDDLLDKLEGTKLTWPAATTESSHERFEVTEKKFQRRVEFFTGDKKAGELFLGSSPGFKKVHVRRAGDKEVYAVVASTFEFNILAKEWLDTSLLAAKQLNEVRGSDYALRKDGENWRFADDASVAPDSAKVAALINSLAELSVQDVAASLPNGEAIKLEVKGDKSAWNYEFVKVGNDHFVKRSDREQYFSVSAQEFEQIAQISKKDLLAPQSDAPAQPENLPQAPAAP